jgi:glycosyltransferase involved in cell wall biosynthesis
MTQRRIAFCGTRGLPATYGGFETAVDELSKRFNARGYECDVFCRLSFSTEPASSYQGRRLVYVSGARHSKLETFVSSIQTGQYLFKHRWEYEHVFWFNNANFPGIVLTLLAGIPLTVNTDGLEWRRKKWAPPFQAYYFLISAVLAKLCKRMISDSRAVQRYYGKTFGKLTEFIPYGAPAHIAVDDYSQCRILQEAGLKRGRYFLQITRIEPDNLPFEIAQGFLKSGLAEQGYKLVVVGCKESTPYARKLKLLSGHDGVIVQPANYDRRTLYTLRSNSFCYVHGNSVGGTNPALLEAMAECPRILAIDTEFSREVLGDLGIYFDKMHIVEGLHASASLPSQRKRLAARVRQYYRWDPVADSYMALAEGKSSVSYVSDPTLLTAKST